MNDRLFCLKICKLQLFCQFVKSYPLTAQYILQQNSFHGAKVYNSNMIITSILNILDDCLHMSLPLCNTSMIVSNFLHVSVALVILWPL